jgi:preprotein translocase subunit SecG
VIIANMGVFAAVWPWVPPVLAILLLLGGLFLVLLVLIQRGKGGGLAGAFGGVGGSSAFGSRAGDTFTKITIYVATGWILLIMILIKTTQPQAETPTPPAVVNPNAPANPPAPQQNPPADTPPGNPS